VPAVAGVLGLSKPPGADVELGDGVAALVHHIDAPVVWADRHPLGTRRVGDGRRRLRAQPPTGEDVEL
jgi:hypothetical protein